MAALATLARWSTPLKEESTVGCSHMGPVQRPRRASSMFAGTAVQGRMGPAVMPLRAPVQGQVLSEIAQGQPSQCRRCKMASTSRGEKRTAHYPAYVA